MVFDKTILTPCPVLRPLDAQFADPIAYLSSPAVAQLGLEYGIVKVVPPEGWRPPFLISPDFRFHTRLQRISDLGLTTRSRRCFIDNINRFLKMRRRRTIELFFEVPVTGCKEPVKVHFYDLYVAVELYGGINNVTMAQWEAINKSFGADPGAKMLISQYNENIRSYALFLASNDRPDYEFPESDSEDDENCLICGKNNMPAQTLLCDNCDNPYHIGCLLPPLETIPGGAWFCDKCLIGTGEYGFEEPTEIKYSLPEFFNMCLNFDAEFVDEYNNGVPLDVDTIERKFWEFIDIEKSDLEVKYGADIHNLKPGQISGFPMVNTPQISVQDPKVRSYIDHPFNLTKLPFAKGSLLNFINTSISGMTVPWIYIGSLLSTFCWHVEDHFTLSANYCHIGATKKWYGIPSKYADRFEELMKKSAPDLFKKQPDLLHQLVTLLSPMTLVKNNIPVVYADQKPNEFVITYPRVYHAGFNCGFNFNEAVNFTMNNWLEFGEQSVDAYRLIKKESVFNHFQLVENILKEFNDEADGEGPHSASKLDLVSRCISSFARFISKQAKLLDSVKGLDAFAVIYQPKVFQKRKFEDEQMGYFLEDTETDKNEEDEDLCDVCRTHLGFQYCVVNNKSHRFSVSAEIPTASSQDTYRKIHIHQLLTPETSPQEVFPKLENDERTASIRESYSSRRLSMLSLPKEEVDYLAKEEVKEHEVRKTAKHNEDEDEYKDHESHGAHEKPTRKTRSASSEKRRLSSSCDTNEVKRRRSSRLVEKVPTIESQRPMRMGKMTQVQHNSQLRELNRRDTVKLCLGCCIRVYGNAKNGTVPRGSTLVYEMEPSAMSKLVETAKTTYEKAAKTHS